MKYLSIRDIYSFGGFQGASQKVAKTFFLMNGDAFDEIRIR